MLGDSFHQLIDTASIFVCIWALRISARKPNDKFTYGYHRLEIIGAIICNTIFLVTSALLIQESIIRICTMTTDKYEPKIVSVIMIIGACIAITVDVVMLFLLKSKKEVAQFYNEYDQCCQ